MSRESAPRHAAKTARRSEVGLEAVHEVVGTEAVPAPVDAEDGPALAALVHRAPLQLHHAAHGTATLGAWRRRVVGAPLFRVGVAALAICKKGASMGTRDGQSLLLNTRVFRSNFVWNSFPLLAPGA